ncbi:MAG: hypothetical protein H6741_14290 [Alphaproteobacteria bacterium]|nr:hypothetical protein [Alphaproteobacteria bacterium]MCB9793885.1 hypothetical protein [Alphaproteobacteria bacterium]
MTLLALLLACGGSAPAPEQLSAGGAVLEAEVDEYTAVEISGTLSLSGEDGSYPATITDSEGVSLGFTLATPTQADLSDLDGAEVDAQLLIFGFEENRSLLLSDAEGPLYVLDAGFSAEEVNALFGAEVVSFGAEAAKDRDSTWTWSYTSLRLSTDDGEVELLPGEVTEVLIQGATYRATAIAAYDREARPNAALPGCPVLEDVLSYELQRVEAAGEEDFLSRPEGKEALSVGCG